MKKLIAAAFFICVFTVSVYAGDYILDESDHIDGNIAKGEDYIQNDGIIVGDAMFFCKTLNSGGAIGGDLLGVFGTSKITTIVGGNIRCIAGGLYFDGTVEKNVTAFCATASFEENSEIKGSIYLAGGDIDLKGTVDGKAYIAAREVIIDGTIKGDLYVYTGKEGKLYINPTANIYGNVFYKGNNACVSPSAIMKSYNEYTVFNNKQKPVMFLICAGLSFLTLIFLAFIINYFTRGLFFRCGESLRLSLKRTAKAFFFLMLIFVLSILFNVLLFILTAFALPFLLAFSIFLLFAGFFIFIWFFSLFPVSCFVGNLITRKNGFFTMLLGFFIVFVIFVLLDIAAMFETLSITAMIFWWAFRLIVLILGSGSIFLSLDKRIKRGKVRQKEVKGE